MYLSSLISFLFKQTFNLGMKNMVQNLKLLYDAGNRDILGTRVDIVNILFQTSTPTHNED